MLTVFWPTLNFLLFFIPGLGKKYWKFKLIKYTYFYPHKKGYIVNITRICL